MSLRLAIFVSGTGSNAQMIIDRFREHPEAGVEVAVVVSNKASAGALAMATERGIPTLVLQRQSFYGTEELLSQLEHFSVNFIALAGFLWLIPAYLVRAYPRKILNIHPALLPKYGGKGMYGMNVHRAVRAAGEPESGMTIHYVNEHYDEGDIVYQAAVRLDSEDSPEDIAARVLRLEHANYWRVIARLAEGKSGAEPDV
jgi:phosphoribosylglycinamide formyltransferase-1